VTKLLLRDVSSVALRSFGRAPVASVGWCVAVAAASAAAVALVVLMIRAFASLVERTSERAASIAALAFMVSVLTVIAIGIGASHAGLGWIAWELERGAVPTFDACARAVGIRMPSIVRASLNVGAMCFAGLLCMYIGALTTAAAFCCALPIVACESRGAIEAIDAGRRMAAPHEWRVLLLYGIATPLVILSYVVGLGGTFVLTSIALPDESIRVATVGAIWVATLIFGAGAGFGSVASGVYVVLRRQVEAASIAEIARRFE
jgi:hypothetical protein